MKTFVSRYHEDVMVKVNGMHRFSGLHKGIDVWMEVLGLISTRYEDFSVTLNNMIVDGDQAFTQLYAKAKGLDADFGYYHKLVEGKIKEFWIYDDSEKMAHAMKAV
jgi:hypothetical protein